MWMRRWSRFALVLALGAAACAPASRKQKLQLGKAAVPPVVRVSNNNFADITIYVVQSGVRERLGMVTGLSEQRFRLPRRFATSSTEIYLIADPVGGFQSYRSPAVYVRAGGEVDLRLHPSLGMSTVSVWGP